MRGRWLARAALTVALGIIVWAALSLAQEAAADDGAGQSAEQSLVLGTGRAGGLATTATGDEGQSTDQEAGQAAPVGIRALEVPTECEHGGPFQDEDVWVFVGRKPWTSFGMSPQTTSGTSSGMSPRMTPGTSLDTSVGLRLQEATFQSPTGESLIETQAEQAYDMAGNTVSWVRAPAGWTLTEVAPGEFSVVGACPATRQGPAIPQGLRGQAVPQGLRGQAIPQGLRGQAIPQGLRGQAIPPGAQPQAGAQVPTLPQTGADVGSMVALGLALVITGLLLLVVRRKRPGPPRRAPDDDALVWTYPRY